MTTAGLIAAAGLSSRMGSFKPLLPLDGGTFIGHIIETFRAAGAAPIVVVTGHEAKRLEAALRGTGTVLLHNERYAETDMFASLCIGLQYLFGRCDRVLLTPADVPLFSDTTVHTLLQSGAPLACPTHDGAPGHPLLVGAALFPALLSFEGEGGLRAALAQLDTPLLSLETEDKGVLLEADTPDEYDALLDQSGRQAIPERADCLALLHARALPEHIVRHCIAVADRALALAAELNAAGCALDLRLVEAGALLHDIVRLEPHHDKAGARLLTELGYPALAPIVANHMDVSGVDRSRISETLVVYLADKQVCEDYPVTVEERYGQRLAKIRDAATAQFVRQKMQDALDVQALIDTARRGKPL